MQPAPSIRASWITRGRVVALLVLVASVGLGSLSGRTVRRARELLHPLRARITSAERERARSLLPNLVEVELRTADGLRLRGWFASGIRRDAIALVHGLGENRASLLDEAALLSRHGHGVLLFDSRASGESDGALATWGDRERLDVRAALDLLSSRAEVDPAQLGLYGFSVGATAAALEAADDPRVRAIALGPVWPDLDEELGDKFRHLDGFSHWLARRTFNEAGVPVASIDARAAIARIPPRPILLLSGSADTDTPPAVMDRIAAAAPGAVRVLIPGAGHGNYDAVAPAAIDRALGGFFDAHLGDR